MCFLYFIFGSGGGDRVAKKTAPSGMLSKGVWWFCKTTSFVWFCLNFCITKRCGNFFVSVRKAVFGHV